MITDIYLVRHGQPQQNSSISYNTPPGPDLSEHGRNEARQAAAFLADKGIEHLFVSPFARTTQTAEVILETLDLPVTFTNLIQEHGPGESFERVRERVRELIGGAEDSPLTRIALVTHGSPIRATLMELSKDKIDLSKHVYSGGNPAPTCGVWHIQHLDDHTRRFELVFKPV
ncbi:histidine phosphatase family protein [Candidatus Gracilibacteria bacterium]|nr:histidine phosphatase family protein [Candidatus Gracilibacteria bacterium]